MKKLYISGQQHNFSQFFLAEKELQINWKTVSPASVAVGLWINRKIIDKPEQWEAGLNLTEYERIQHRLPDVEYIRSNLLNLLCCDAIALLPGWKESKHSLAELHIAELMGMEVFEYFNYHLYKKRK